MLLRQPIHPTIRALCSSARQQWLVFAPYITLPALTEILPQGQDIAVTVITTWKTEDILHGASDLAVFPYLQARGAQLRLLPGLHMKAFVADFHEAILSTGNVTQAGLGLSPSCNIECAVEVTLLNPADRLWFAQLLKEGIVVTDALYTAAQQCVAHAAADRKTEAVADVPLEDFRRKQDFYLSALPAYPDPEQLLDDLYRQEGLPPRFSPDSTWLHDVVLYGLDPALSRDANRQRLRQAFFAQPLIQAFTAFIQIPHYFGEIKAWLQRTCADTPPPMRRDLTEPTQRLLAWTTMLGDGCYVINRPHYSQCIAKVA